MLRSLKDLEHYELSATDGDVGKVVNFFLDDERWTIRYLIAQTGSFFNNRRVLISPISLRQADWSSRRFHVALTRDKVKNSPNVEVDKPVSRQHELDYYSYYGYPYYWGSAGLWGVGAYPGLLTGGLYAAAPHEQSGDVHLRSVNELRGYHIQGTDEEIGHVEDFIVDDESWEVRYLVINTSNWWVGKKVLVSPQWATEVNWFEHKVYVEASREFIKNSPEWNGSAPVNREFEARLYNYYGRPIYWSAGGRPLGAETRAAGSHPG